VAASVAEPYTDSWVFARSVLAAFIGRYSADAALDMSRMFVLSTAQWATLTQRNGTEPSGRLLDIGAGDGHITQKAAPLFEEVVATESSWWLCRRIRQRGLTAVHAGSIRDAGLCEGGFDVVSALNLLDRIDDPVGLLRDMRDALAPGGLVVMAVVLPFCPTVIDGGTQRRPAHTLNIPGCGKASWEMCVDRLCQVVEEAGFEVVSLSRIPYMSHGDSCGDLYTLDDSVVVMRHNR